MSPTITTPTSAHTPTSVRTPRQASHFISPGLSIASESVPGASQTSLYKTESGSETSCDSNNSQTGSSFQDTLVNQKKFILFESELDKLLLGSRCLEDGCLSLVDNIKKSEHEGSLITVYMTCINGHQRIWKSQPLLGKLPAGNLLIASSIMFSGSIFSVFHSFFEFMGLRGISKTTFYQLQRTLVIPEIKLAWIREEQDILSKLRENSVIKLSGDGRCDSPGHSAKFCSYTFMDQLTNKCVHFELVQKSEVEFKSNNMEIEGLKRCLKKFDNESLKISQLTTDRHIQIRAFLKRSYPEIQHQFDVWHLAKWIRKRLLALSKLKQHQSLQPWVKSLSNHLWYCAENCQGDTEVLIGMWKSICLHVINVHKFPQLDNFMACGHQDLDEDEERTKEWLVPNSPTHVALHKMVNHTRLINDIKQINEFSHTSALESYHNLVNKYCCKRQDFDYDVMEARMILCGFDHNFNSDRKLIYDVNELNETTEQKYHFYYSKATSEWHARPVKEPKTYTYVYEILGNILA